MSSYILLILALLLTTCVASNLAVKSLVDSKPTGTNACIAKQTCHDCIQTPGCAWCSKPVRLNKIFFFF